MRPPTSSIDDLLNQRRRPSGAFHRWRAIGGRSRDPHRLRARPSVDAPSRAPVAARPAARSRPTAAPRPRRARTVGARARLRHAVTTRPPAARFRPPACARGRIRAAPAARCAASASSIDDVRADDHLPPPFCSVRVKAGSPTAATRAAIGARAAASCDRATARLKLAPVGIVRTIAEPPRCPASSATDDPRPRAPRHGDGRRDATHLAEDQHAVRRRQVQPIAELDAARLEPAGRPARSPHGRRPRRPCATAAARARGAPRGRRDRRRRRRSEIA